MSDHLNSDPSSPLIITREEATSSHVDDLLKRQMSMRGEPGVTRGHRRKWYFQNWLVLGLAGAIGAIVAWALLEPVFDDQIHVEGTIENLNLADWLPAHLDLGDQTFQLNRGTEGSFTINGETIHLLDNVRDLRPGGPRPLDRSTLHNGDYIGVYVELVSGPKAEYALATFVDHPTPPATVTDKPRTLLQLAARSRAAGMLIFALVAGLIGLFIGSVDGIVCRLPRRALLSGGVGLAVGLLGGFFCSIIANLVYAPLTEMAMHQMGKNGMFGAFGFLVQMTGRSLAWCLAGAAMGLGQGIALRSGRLLIYGLIGGVLGGLLGGMLFDPIDLLLLGADKPSSHWSRLIGFAVIGLSVGVMIGLVEIMARDAWLRMTQGPLTGKEFLIFKDVMTIGSSPRSDLFLFNDTQVMRQHAIIRAVGDQSEIETRDSAAAVLLNNRPVQRARLRHGDNVTIGRTSFVFQRRKS